MHVHIPGYWVLSENSQQEKPICPNRKNEFRQNTKNRQSAKINSRKKLVPHSRYVALARLRYFAIVMQITLSPLQRLPFPSCPACFLFSPSPQPPYDRRSLCRGESAKKLNVVTNTTVLFRCHFILIKLLAHSLPVFLIMHTYRKIPKISPGAYIFQRPFLRGLFLEGLI